MKCIYIHLNFNNFSFSKEFEQNSFVSEKLPDYANLSITQSKKFMGEDPIVITNDNLSEHEINEIEKFYSFCRVKFPSFHKNTFWFITLTRILVLYLIVKKLNISKFIHLEYDNLIYSDMKELDILEPGIYFTRVGKFLSSAGFVYCNDIPSFDKFVSNLLGLINCHEDNVRKLTFYPHLSEMVMIDIIQRKAQGVVKYLPILPFDFPEDGFERLGVVFDGASYGQFLGGTQDPSSVGFYAPHHHFIGHNIGNNKINVKFDRYPKVLYDDKEYKILNLHIHSKKLENFLVND